MRRDDVLDQATVHWRQRWYGHRRPLAVGGRMGPLQRTVTLLYAAPFARLRDSEDAFLARLRAREAGPGDEPWREHYQWASYLRVGREAQ